MKNTTLKKPSAFDAFFAVGGDTPANAVRLAIEDARAKPLIDWQLIDALRVAERRLDLHDELVAALRDHRALLDQCELDVDYYVSDEALARREAVETVLAKLEVRS